MCVRSDLGDHNGDDGKGTMSDGAPGDVRGAATDCAPDNVPASSWLGRDIALSENMGRMASNETRGGSGRGQGEKAPDH